MGKLLFLRDFRVAGNHAAEWYFDDVYYSSDTRNYRFKWPNPAFPKLIAIHSDEIGTHKISIRKWIDNNDVGTVIHEHVDKSYRVWWSDDPKKRNFDHTSQIANNWEVFHFEDEESALAFALRFSDLVRPVTEDHPTQHYGERYKR